MLTLILAALMQTHAPAASAVPTDQSAPQIVVPDWRRRPTSADLERVIARTIKTSGLSGAVLITCGVNEKGLLVDCTVLQEIPAGYGFGEAALKLADRFEMRPPTKNGVPVTGATVRIPIRFNAQGAR